METSLQAGDEVFVNSGIEPKLIFTISEIVNEAGQLMACGEYGCFAVELLKKADSVPVPSNSHP